MIAWISTTQSLLDIFIAAAISTLMLGIGLYGRRRASTSQDDVNGRRHIRGLWVVAGMVGSLMTLYVGRLETSYGYGRDSSDVLATGATVVIGLVGGVLLILLGIRGRWRGEHTHCRRCGFDLYGKPPESTVCNECGADLTAPRATSLGLRQRRLAPLLTGVFMLTVSLAVGVSVGSAIVQSPGRVSLIKYKPTWWLVRQVDARSLAPNIERELMTRLLDGTLSNEQVEQIVERAEAGPDVNVTASFADGFALNAWLRSQLSEAAMRRSLRRQLGLTGNLSATATPNRIGYNVFGGTYFFWARGLRSQFSYAATNMTCEINGVPVPGSAIQTSWLSPQHLFSVFGNLVIPPVPLAPGPARVKIAAHVSVTLAAQGRQSLTEEQDITLIDGVTSVVDRLARPSGDDPETEAFAAVVRLAAAADGGTDVTLTCSAPTRASLASDAFLRSKDGEERKLGSLTIAGGTGTLHTVLPPPALDPTFEIVLRPTTQPSGVPDSSPAKAPIVIDAPLIQRDAATTRPATRPATG